jgi:phage shock protein C
MKPAHYNYVSSFAQGEWPLGATSGEERSGNTMGGSAGVLPLSRGIEVFMIARNYDMIDRGPLRRSRENKRIAGVVGGLAHFFGIDPTVARVGYVLLSVLSAGFPGILVYILLWVIIPVEEY